MSSAKASNFRIFLQRFMPFLFKEGPHCHNKHWTWDRRCFCCRHEYFCDWYGGVYDFKTKQEYSVDKEWYVDGYSYVNSKRKNADKQFPVYSIGPVTIDEATKCVSRLKIGGHCGIDEIRITNKFALALSALEGLL